MAEPSSKNQPKRKRTNVKKASVEQHEADDVFDEEREKFNQDSVLNVISEIKAEVDDTVESLNENSTNLMVLIDDLKREEDFAVDETSSSQDVQRVVDTGSVGKSKGGKRLNTSKGKQKGAKKTKFGESSIVEDIEDSSNSQFSLSVTSIQSSSNHMNGMDSASESNEANLVSDTEDSNYDIMDGDIDQKPDGEMFKTEPRRRYPFQLSHSDYLKFTESALKHNFGNTSNDQPECSQSNENQENGEEDDPDKKGTFNLQPEVEEENIDLEELRKKRLERLNKLNEAIDYIKDILDKLSEKENSVNTDNYCSIVPIKSEIDEDFTGEPREIMIKEETIVENDMETKEEVVE